MEVISNRPATSKTYLDPAIRTIMTLGLASGYLHYLDGLGNNQENDSRITV